MPMLLAVDAGGTSTRALLLDHSGRAAGYGRAGGGNPTAAGIEEAVAAIGTAAERAGASRPIAFGETSSLALIAMAGEQTALFGQRVSARLAALGWPRVVLEHDLLGIFHSGTCVRDGYALIAGTGSVAARVVGGSLAQVVGGRGWLLGDAGGGFWIGHRVARSVVAALDGQGPPTALTELVAKAVGISADPASTAGRARTLRQLVSALYARRPVSLAEFAPLAFAVGDDPTARSILLDAASALAGLVDAVRVPGLDGPVVGGGSVLVRGFLAAQPDLGRQLTPLPGGAGLVPVSDGVVGAAVLALRSAGVEVDETVFGTLQGEVARVAR
ncbi:MAG: N-acetylglucosamine kinase [Actinomycetes bacterium]